MSFLNNPLVVETMLDEKTITPQEIEMAQRYEEAKAAQVTPPRRLPGLLRRLHGLLVAMWRHRPHLTYNKTLASVAVGAVLLLSACSPGVGSIATTGAFVPPTAEISEASAGTAAQIDDAPAANSCAHRATAADGNIPLKPH